MDHRACRFPSGRFLRFLLLPVALACPSISAHAADWQPTPAELKMTADPAAPGAPAVYLYREETTDDKFHVHSLYVRIKVLTEKGKSYGDVEVSGYDGRDFSITDVTGRTIHADGTVIPLTEKPIKKLLLREGKTRYMATVFSMPAVEPGCILEYRYKLRYDDNLAVPPHWLIQQPIFMHQAHYHFVPTEHDLLDGKHGDLVVGMMYSGRLPAGVQVKNTHDLFYDLDLSEVPPAPDESYMPPMQSLTYRLFFYYASSRSVDEYWKREGKSWSKDVNHFADPSKAMHAAVDSLTSPTDTPDAKLHKLYNAVMTLENTSFTREHTAAENKADKIKVSSADDIWAQKRGTSDELNRLFLALARAAGFKAWDMAVVNRNRDLLLTDYLDWNQLDDEIAIVEVNGKEIYFDPGQRYAEYGKLHWKHTLSRGVRQTADGTTAFGESPSISYKDTSVTRIADLSVDEHGQVSGTVAITMNGAEALHWRQRRLEVDDDTLKRDYEHSVRDQFPPGVTARMDHFIGLEDPDHMLMARFNVEGSLGTAAGHRLLFPASFFIASTGSLFTQQARQTPIDLRYPILRKDTVTLKLPSGLKAESLPAESNLTLPQMAVYGSKCVEKDGIYHYSRTFALGVALYTAQEYPSLREFYAKMGVKDEEQSVLSVAPEGATKGSE